MQSRVIFEFRAALNRSLLVLWETFSASAHSRNRFLNPLCLLVRDVIISGSITIADLANQMSVKAVAAVSGSIGLN